MLHFHIISLFPESFESYFSVSIIKRALEDKKLKISYYNPRDFTKDKFKRVDQKPYGGGPGMVIEAPSTVRAIQKAIGRKKNVEVIFFSPGGELFTNQIAKEYGNPAEFLEKSQKTKKAPQHIVFICGRYEGVDERVNTIFNARKISLGDYVITGGELGAMIMIDAIARQIPGVLGDIDSLEESRAASHEVYTRPESFKYKGVEYTVPEVLLSGNHKKIEEWRAHKAQKDIKKM